MIKPGDKLIVKSREEILKICDMYDCAFVDVMFNLCDKEVTVRSFGLQENLDGPVIRLYESGYCWNEWMFKFSSIKQMEIE